jgi:cation transport ATPase
MILIKYGADLLTKYSVYAGFGMSLSSVLVLIHTMRLERWQPSAAAFGDSLTHLGKKQ